VISVLICCQVVGNHTNNKHISVVSGKNFDFSKSIPDFYTADCLNLPFFVIAAKIKITENILFSAIFHFWWSLLVTPVEPGYVVVTK